MSYLCSNFIELKTKYSFLNFRERSITTPISGATEMPIILQEGRLGLTYKRPSYRPTGTRPFPRSVLVWRSAIKKSSLSSTNTPTLCIHWSLTEDTAPPHWVVTRGRRWLVYRPLCRPTVTRKGSILWFVAPILKQESVSLVTSKITAAAVIPESGLVQEGYTMTPTRVETKQRAHQIMEINTSKPWDIFWFSDKTCLNDFWCHFMKKNTVKRASKVNWLAQQLWWLEL